MKKFLLLVLLSFGGLFAQEPAPAGPAVQLVFKTVGLGLRRDDLFIKKPKGFFPLVIESEAISTKSVTYNGPAVLPLFKKVKAADKFTYEPAGEIAFPVNDPKEPARFLVLFLPGAGPAGLRINVVPDDTTSFPTQSVRVINVLPAPAGVMVNKDSDLLKPGQIRLFPTRAQDERVEIHIAVQHRNKWVEVNNNVYSSEKDARRTVFLVNNTPAGAPATQLPSIGFISLVDLPNAPEPPNTEDRDLDI